MREFKGRFTKIKDVSDRRRMPRLGKIRLGVKVAGAGKADSEYPRETEYFVVPPEVAKVYGSKPAELDVMVPLNDLNAVFPQSYKWYGGSRGLKCIGDGETAMRLDEKTQTMLDRECPCELRDQKACQKRAHLMVLLPRVNMGGVYQIDVGSFHSIIDINSGLEFVQALIGRFAMIPLRLRRVPRETHANGQKQVHYTLQVVLDADVDTINALRENTHRVLLSTHGITLPAPDDVNPAFDDGAAVVVENGDAGNGKSGAAVSKTADGGHGETDPVRYRLDGTQMAGQIQGKVSQELPMTQQQVAAIMKLCVKAGVPDAKILRRLQVGITQKEAAELIVALQGGDASAFDDIPTRKAAGGKW